MKKNDTQKDWWRCWWYDWAEQISSQTHKKQLHDAEIWYPTSFTSFTISFKCFFFLSILSFDLPELTFTDYEDFVCRINRLSVTDNNLLAHNLNIRYTTSPDREKAKNFNHSKIMASCRRLLVLLYELF